MGEKKKRKRDIYDEGGKKGRNDNRANAYASSMSLLATVRVTKKGKGGKKKMGKPTLSTPFS